MSVPWKKETDTGLKLHEGEKMMTEYIFCVCLQTIPVELPAPLRRSERNGIISPAYWTHCELTRSFAYGKSPGCPVAHIL